MSNRNISNLYGIVYELIKKIEQNIGMFENIIKNQSIKKNLPNVDTVYMYTIILDISKIINSTKSDKTGLKQLESCLPKKYKSEIFELKKKFKKIFQKIIANRNRIVAHIDISNQRAYWNMGLSGKEIKKIIDDYKKLNFYDKRVSDVDDMFIKNIWKTKTKKGGDEQYRLSDFQKDIPKFKKILKKIKEINSGLLVIIKQTTKT